MQFVEIPDFGSSLVDVAIRTAIVYLFLVVALRLAGKREVGQLSILDLVVLLVIADAVQNAMVGENTSLAGGLIAAGTLVLLDRLLKVAVDRSRRVRSVIQGEPRMLIRDGIVLDKALREEGIERAELDAAIRAHGLVAVLDVALAVLETDGTISIVPRSRTDSNVGRTPPPTGIR
jgi:uncharacterized membrane protein YcaP (DUF421 family)